MAQRVADFVVRRRPFGPKVVVRVDLHGISSFGPGDARTLIRWEWIEGIAVDDGVVVRSAHDRVELPAGAFGFEPDALARRLEEARNITRRPEIIGELAAH